MRDSIMAIQAIHHTFSQVVLDDSMEEWAPTMFGDYQAVDMGNLYFTNRKHVSSSELVRFKAGVDPDAMLEAVLEGTELLTHERMRWSTLSYMNILGVRKGTHAYLLLSTMTKLYHTNTDTMLSIPSNSGLVILWRPSDFHRCPSQREKIQNDHCIACAYST
jgi:hypothetical protein